MTNQESETVRAAKGTRKRKKERGIIHERKWAAADGSAKSAWQADFGTINGKRLWRKVRQRIAER